MINDWRKYYGVNNGTEIKFWFDKILNHKKKYLSL